MAYERQFLVGNTNLTKSGKQVKIIEETVFRSPYYTHVLGDDGIWRRDRYQDIGVCSSGSTENDLVASKGDE